MPPIPKFAEALTKRAKTESEVFTKTLGTKSKKHCKGIKPKKPIPKIISAEVNEIHKAYARNLKRVKLVNPDFSLEKIPMKGAFRYLSQQLAAYKGQLGTDNLQTPFGTAEVEYRRGTERMLDKHITRPIPTKYEDIGMSIDMVVEETKFSAFYKIILDYLETPASDKYAGKKLSDITIANNDFFKKKDNLKSGVSEGEIDYAINAATSLCAIFMVSESSRNRLFDGGKASRALFRNNTEENVTTKLKRLPSTKKGGTLEARQVAQNLTSSEKWREIASSLSPKSEDESFDYEDKKNKLKEAIKANIDKFLTNSNIAQLQQIATIMQIPLTIVKK